MKSEGLSSEKEKNEWMKMFNHLRFFIEVAGSPSYFIKNRKIFL